MCILCVSLPVEQCLLLDSMLHPLSGWAWASGESVGWFTMNWVFKYIMITELYTFIHQLY